MVSISDGQDELKKVTNPPKKNSRTRLSRHVGGARLQCAAPTPKSQLRTRPCVGSHGPAKSDGLETGPVKPIDVTVPYSSRPSLISPCTPVRSLPRLRRNSVTVLPPRRRPPPVQFLRELHRKAARWFRRRRKRRRRPNSASRRSATR